MTFSKAVIYVATTKMLEMFTFYHDVIGLESLQEQNPYWFEFKTGGCHLCVHSWKKAPEENDQSDHHKTHFVLCCGNKEEVMAFRQRLVDGGMTSIDEVLPSSNSEIGKLFSRGEGADSYTSFVLQDPAGNMVQVESDRQA